jgi:hypothetical protein
VKTERLVQVLILIFIASMAGAASFAHVHNWTMSNAPRGTGSWFGWANAVISELTPTAAGIEIRRRKRTRQSVRYPMAILIAAAVLSLTAQVSEARPTVSGWISSAVPALAFLALTKLVLSSPRTAPEKENSECAAQPASASDAPTHNPAPAPMTTGAPATATGTTSPAVPWSEDNSSSPDAPALTASPSDGPQALPTGQLLISARMAAFSHRQQTGTPITPGELATRMSIPPALAESLLDHLDGTTPPPVTAANGTAMNGSRP